MSKQLSSTAVPSAAPSAGTCARLTNRLASRLIGVTLTFMLCFGMFAPARAFAQASDIDQDRSESSAKEALINPQFSVFDDEGGSGDPGTGGGDTDPGGGGGGTDPGGGGTDPGTGGGGTDPGGGGGTDPGGGGGTDPGTGGGGTDPGGGGGTDPGTGGGGTDPGGGGGTDPGTGGGGSTDPDDDLTLWQLQMRAYNTDASGSYLQLLNRTMEGNAYRLVGGIGEKGGRVRLMLGATWADTGQFWWQSDAGWHNIGDVSWSSSNSAVASVNAQGIVTALGDGEVSIIATTRGTAPGVSAGVSAEFRITVFGQDGAFVQSAEICDESGEEYGNTYILIKEISSAQNIQFNVRLYYSDGTSQSNALGASDYSAAFSAGTVIWSIDSEDVGSVNSASGYFIPGHDGTTSVRVTVTGGDPTKHSGYVYDDVYISVDTGRYEGGNMPSSSLKIKVYFEKNPELVKDRELSIGELQGISYVQRTYTLTRGYNQYVTDSAVGCDLAALLASLGIDLGDIAYFTFVANDGANPGTITPSFLFTTRYYFPLVDWGVTNEAEAVAPMLAYADSWKENGSPEKNYSSLNSGTCLRLLFGSTGLSDGSTSRSLKYINTMTVVLNGAAPVGWGNGDGDGDEGDGDGDGDGDEGDGDEGDDDDTGDSDNTGDGDKNDDTNGGTITKSDNNSNTTATTKSSQSDTTTTEVTGGQMYQFGDPSTPLSQASGGESSSSKSASSTPPPSKSSRWQVFEMMNKINSDVDPIPFTNPLEPYAIPAALGVAATGGLYSALRYRRRLGPLGFSPAKLAATTLATLFARLIPH